MSLVALMWVRDSLGGGLMGHTVCCDQEMVSAICLQAALAVFPEGLLDRAFYAR